MFQSICLVIIEIRNLYSRYGPSIRRGIMLTDKNKIEQLNNRMRPLSITRGMFPVGCKIHSTVSVANGASDWKGLA